MKIKYPALLLAMASAPTLATDIFINELHYDNLDTDTGEFIEVVAPENTDLSNYSLVLYNGSNGLTYNTTTLGPVANLGNGYGSYSVTYPTNGIQNGSPDGIALVDGTGRVIQFLSYEGEFTANDGPAAGLASENIGVAQESSTAVGSSLQLSGGGKVYADFTWQITDSNTQDATNTDQTFLTDSVPFINELHYDNAGSDVDEFVEIAARAGTDLSGYSLEFYNGNGGSLYATEPLTGVITDQQGGMGTIAFEKSGIQNGSPDGVALISPEGEIVQFLSYEGQFTASDGTAAGIESTDILVSEAYSSPVGYSLQLGGQGTSYAEFTWQTSNASTANAVNVNQIFGNGNDGGDGGAGGNDADFSALFINEFHYDNVNTDVGEMIEIAGPAGTDLSTITIVLYNGNNNAPYQTLSLSGSIPEQQNGFGTVVVTHPGIQNGAPDGIALVAGEDVIEFISYEGTMTAESGPAAGMTSEDVIVSESSSTPVGFSLQRTGQGNKRCSFTRQEPAAESAGLINNGQIFSAIDETECGGNDNGGDTPVELGQCGTPATLISAIQGNGLATTMPNSDVVAEAVITVRAPNMSGFFIQEESTDDDNNAATSEGIFVHAPTLVDSVSEGEVIRLAATAEEFYDKTQLTNVIAHTICGDAAIMPTHVSLPKASATSFEAFEGMLVTSEQEWIISSNYNYNRFGELVASPERLYNPTQNHLPGSEAAIAQANANQLNQILVDDLANGSNADLYLPAGGFGPTNPVRAGQTITRVTGIVDHDFGAYRIRVSQNPDLIDTNPREANPVIAEGNLKLASFNVLNLFNGDGEGSGFPTSRGADSISEYQRQLSKIVNAIVRIDADIVGLMEIENDGFGPNSAIAQLVDALNADYGASVYDFVDLGGPVGTDQITVGIIYKPAEVEPVEAAKVLTQANSPTDENGVLFDTSRNRPSVAQLFKHTESGQEFVVDVNHFKSKGSRCGAGDDDNATGQGNCNLTRTRAAQGVSMWLAEEFPHTPVMLMGDLNSYGMEDPIRFLADSGYVDAARLIIGDTAYSYTFFGEAGTLDYLMANNEAQAWLLDATEWHINTDESVAFDYNEERKPVDWLNTLVYRASDHDPVIATFSLPEAVMTGDFDMDGDVDFDDLRKLVLAVVFRRNVQPEYDLNMDGKLDLRDINLLRSLCTLRRCRRP
ncbi:ExeM/NucH family extracellular endonuclease [Alteromonas sp. ASW11-130]|uniref:ExeM/NucH family extracellular endonuclease n=1 Tax=Alteromonas sp. ASW11-130 TaxID=3015775 RepID=UPI0022421C7E|nr:ExeM/NucH family extracellular endonuclease [Alteromonas sp. ASW11-130]MCW8090520.1 ExeM/NucH family extracellular endonuclease [Alteromonas sp. ASW11-130]